jgi:hypothetical protein
MNEFIIQTTILVGLSSLLFGGAFALLIATGTKRTYMFDDDEPEEPKLFGLSKWRIERENRRTKNG